ncbi:MAG: 5-(carboxyamino)imidazole ribonucleotide mutase [bacterium]|nr:5-(carboxyamino)imidazole ribonucleotide mutase [bacterium]
MLVTFLLGSKSDTEFTEKIAAELDAFGVPHQIIVASAHKVPEKVVEVINQLNADPQPQVVITVVGMSNGLGGVTAGSCIHPVVNCPPYASLEEYMVDFNSNVRMPSDVPVMTVLHPKNAALSAIKILAEGDNELKEKVIARIKAVKATY